VFLDDRKTLWRKLRELALAVRIERQFEKDKILEMYLNKVYFGHGFYGVEAAARGYFAKAASGLATDESALLAGLIQAPSAYAPQAHPAKALARRAIVLTRMVDAGYLTKDRADRLRKEAIRLHETPSADTFGRYFKSYVTRQLVQRYGEDQVFDGGLRVYTSLDPAMQRAAEQTLSEGIGADRAAARLQPPEICRARSTDGCEGSRGECDGRRDVIPARCARGDRCRDRGDSRAGGRT